MGYDLYGKKPTAAEGRYFRRNVWRWPDIVETCHAVAPWQTWRCRDWYGSKCWGNGLSDKYSLGLAKKLEQRLADRGVTRFLAVLQEPMCDEIDIREFVAFLKACGGFEIM